jgi:hypothetical protein
MNLKDIEFNYPTTTIHQRSTELNLIYEASIESKWSSIMTNVLLDILLFNLF